VIVFRFLILAMIGLASLAAETIHLKTRNFEPPADLNEYVTRPLLRRTAGTSHYLIQFQAPVSATIIRKLNAHGVVVTAYVGKSTLMVAAPDDFSVAGLAVRWIGRLEHQDKISPAISEQAASGHAPGVYVVEFQGDVNMQEARAMVREHNLRLIENRYLLAHHLLVGGDFSAISRMAAWDEVAYIFPPSPGLLAGRHVYPCEGAVVLGTTAGQYVGTGYPWNVTNGLTLGYFFSQLTEKLPATSSQSDILRAFKEWAKYANVSFSSAPNAQAPQTINILFATGAHGDPYPFDSPTVLAHTFYPAPLNAEPIAGDMHLNDDERWQVGADTDLYSVALHEAGHALGLVHVDDPSQVMYPYYQMHTTLGTGDISVVQSYYGAAAGSTPSQPSQPTPATLTLTVQSPAATSTSTAISVSGITTGGVAPVEVAWSTAAGQIGNALGSANWSITSIPLTLGANNITITAFDAASHTASQTITVTRQAPTPPLPSMPSAPSTPSGPQPGSTGDTTPPTVRITNPASTILSTTASSITFQGLASDNVGVTSVTWSTSTGVSGSATGTLTWTAANIPLLVGSNTVTVRAYDAAGNSAWRAVTVVRTSN
jgi:Matrixin/Bacterial Ig domain